MFVSMEDSQQRHLLPCWPALGVSLSLSWNSWHVQIENQHLLASLFTNDLHCQQWALCSQVFLLEIEEDFHSFPFFLFSCLFFFQQNVLTVELRWIDVSNLCFAFNTYCSLTEDKTLKDHLSILYYFEMILHLTENLKSVMLFEKGKVV